MHMQKGQVSIILETEHRSTKLFGQAHFNKKPCDALYTYIPSVKYEIGQTSLMGMILIKVRTFCILLRLERKNRGEKW